MKAYYNDVCAPSIKRRKYRHFCLYTQENERKRNYGTGKQSHCQR